MNRTQSKGELLSHYLNEAGDMRDKKKLEVELLNCRGSLG
jgi:hypothetical protein